MNCFERELATYFLAWLPFSGPEPDEVFAQFGMTRSRAAGQLLAVVSEARRSVPAKNLKMTHRDRELLAKLIRNQSKLRLLQVDGEVFRPAYPNR
ncbi:MAG: hypothetical protein WDA07_13150 [Leucobacter sp.]